MLLGAFQLAGWLLVLIVYRAGLGVSPTFMVAH